MKKRLFISLWFIWLVLFTDPVSTSSNHNNELLKHTIDSWIDQHIAGSEKNPFEIINGFFRSRPELPQLLTVCITQNFNERKFLPKIFEGEEETKICDLYETLKSIGEDFISFSSSKEEKKKLHQYSVNMVGSGVVGSRPSAPKFLSGQQTGAFVWRSQFVAMIAFGFCLVLSDISDDSEIVEAYGKNAYERPSMLKFISKYLFSTNKDVELPPINTVIERWKTIRSVFSTFDRWYEVYSNPSIEQYRSGGVTRICRDWLQYFLPKISTQDSEEQSEIVWEDTEKIFVPNLDSDYIRSLARNASKAEKAWRERHEEVEKKEEKKRKITGSSPGAKSPPVERQPKIPSQKLTDNEILERKTQLKKELEKLWKTSSYQHVGKEEKLDQATDKKAINEMNKEFESNIWSSLEKQLNFDKKDLAGVVCPEEIKGDSETLYQALELVLADPIRRTAFEVSGESEEDIRAILMTSTPGLTKAQLTELTDKRIGYHVLLCSFLERSFQDQAYEKTFGKTSEEVERIIYDFIDQKSQGIREMQWAKWWLFKFHLRYLNEQEKRYWSSKGPRSRLKNIFSQSVISNSDTVTRSDPNSYNLPRQDLEMCWTIMETALYTRAFSNLKPRPLEGGNAILLSAIHITMGIIAIMAAVYLLGQIQSRGVELRAINQLCPTIDLDFDTVNLVCTDGWRIGTYCTLSCVNGNTPATEDGDLLPVLYSCSSGITWTPSAPTTVDCSKDFSLPSFGY
eukprot:c19333_g1_i2.p1 GENE.c19333_g1_i2~~c19333_g1_i2.p1  ORF type:complete len:739 (+),score=232.78 c19333_g1_i2:46-2262(+)